ncbi:hypothetical protein B0H65DRAFT_233512 [Neurospora tetraspora]|uniref:Uncharacterized protein n=1 Tax=Neurospora tetraspora TaxID=94610 RepID=A0AAE0JDK8_9PEZI|nr:hypothetical protein B0H65DRAFT_233512 [Neurospora tetraspora]
MTDRLICVGATQQQQPVGTLLLDLSPPEYKTNISIALGGQMHGFTLDLPKMALVCSHWPSQIFISSEWLEPLGLETEHFPDNQPKLFDTPQGPFEACRRVTTTISLPQLQYGPVHVEAIVLEYLGSGVA